MQLSGHTSRPTPEKPTAEPEDALQLRCHGDLSKLESYRKRTQIACCIGTYFMHMLYSVHAIQVIKKHVHIVHRHVYIQTCSTIYIYVYIYMYMCI